MLVFGTARCQICLEMINPIDAIDQERQPLCGMYDGRAVIEMIAAVFESQRVGGPVALPLVRRDNPLASFK